MTASLSYYSRTKIVFGENSYLNLPTQIESLVGKSRVLIVTDPGVKMVGILEQVERVLQEADFVVDVYAEVTPDPSVTQIDDVANIIRKNGSKCVIGLGGGSAMDVAKMATLVSSDVHQTMHYALMANPFTESEVVNIAIPTTSGTGAEVTSTVVFSNNEGRKVWGWDENMAPSLALLEPTFTVNLPIHLTVATTLDAMIHAIEAVSGRRSNPIIEALSYQSIRLINENYEKVLQNPQDVEARGNLSLGATLAGLAIEQGGTGLAHCIGHALGTVAKIPHGRAVALALYNIIDWNVTNAPASYKTVAHAMDIEWNDEAPAKIAARYKRLVEIGQLDLSLEQSNAKDLDVAQFVQIMQAEENQPMLQNSCEIPTEEQLTTFAESILNS
ncbi:MAG: iron-containing alcohol dehydrogenase [Lysinibacillus sp.]